MRCANVTSCEEVKSGKCSGIQIKHKYPCDGFKWVEADSCDGCIHTIGDVHIACNHCCRNELNKVDNYKFAGGE